jgi:hypothetical protein
MTIEVFGPIAICTDCLMFAANGWESDEPIPPELLDNPDANAGWRLGAGWSADDDSEGWFNWSPCDWCRRPLGGDRYTGHVFR